MILRPGDGGFERARRELSATAAVPDAEPAAIVRPRTVDDVAAAVRAAASNGSQVTVRSGGHSLSGTYLRDGAVAIDLRDLNSCTVSADRRRAAIGPGSTSAVAAGALASAGLTFPVGHAPAVGLGGFLLAGGNGWAVGGGRPAAHRVIGATVVAGDGTVRTIGVGNSADAGAAGADAGAPGTTSVDTELLWALRGAGPAFPGIVTEFVLAVEPAGPAVLRHFRTVPAAAAEHLGAALDALGPLPDGIEVTVVVRPGPDGGTMLVTTTGFPTGTADATPGFAAVRDLDVPAIGTPATRTFPSIAALLADLPDHSGDAQWSDHRWSDGGWQATLAALPMDLPGPSDRSSVLISPAPARSTIPAMYQPPTALGVAAYAHWTPGEPADAGREWTGRMLAGTGGDDPRRYVGEADLTGGRADVERAFPVNTLPRLARLRDAVDPQRVIASLLDD